VLLAATAAALATVGFAGLGFLLAGAGSGLMVLAAANAIYLVLLLVSGLVFPLEEFASGVRSVVRLLPSTALGEIIHGAMRTTADAPTRAWLVLAVWAVVGPVVASRVFRWSP
jgi:ABC-2 type transport system permease protein